MTDLDATNGGEPHPQYMVFLLVFFFFLTGLLGFLICHMLKKKGYRCRTGGLEEEEECKDKLAPDDGPEENQDTVEQILKCIIENEANMEAFKEMLGNQNPCEHNVARDWRFWTDPDQRSQGRPFVFLPGSPQLRSNHGGS